MSIFTRLSDIIKSNVNDLIDRAEDPEKMVKQIILDMQEELADATRALGKAMASERMVMKQYDDAVKQSEEWEEKAKLALKNGNSDLAKQAVEKKLKADESAVQFKAICETVSAQTETIRGQVGIIKEKLEEAKSREAMLIARSQMADTQRELAKTIGGMNSGSAFDKMAKMEDKINRKEAQAQAFSEVTGTDTAGEPDPYEKMKTEAAVEGELARLMQELDGGIDTEKQA